MVRAQGMRPEVRQHCRWRPGRHDTFAVLSGPYLPSPPTGRHHGPGLSAGYRFDQP
jgi:hypothetical protein